MNDFGTAFDIFDRHVSPILKTAGEEDQRWATGKVDEGSLNIEEYNLKDFVEYSKDSKFDNAIGSIMHPNNPTLDYIGPRILRKFLVGHTSDSQPYSFVKTKRRLKNFGTMNSKTMRKPQVILASINKLALQKCKGLLIEVR